MIWTIAAGVFIGLLLWAMRALVFTGVMWIAVLAVLLFGLFVAATAGLFLGIGVGNAWPLFGGPSILLLATGVSIAAVFNVFKSMNPDGFKRKPYLYALAYTSLAVLLWSGHWASVEGIRATLREHTVRQIAPEPALNVPVAAANQLDTLASMVPAEHKTSLGAPAAVAAEVISSWSASRNVASANGPSVRIQVLFPMNDTGPARLVVASDRITGCAPIEVVVDGMAFGSFPSESSCVLAACCSFELSNTLLRTLKFGRHATLRIESPIVIQPLSIDLSGSAAAFNEAWAYSAQYLPEATTVGAAN